MRLRLKWDERDLQFYRESENFTTRDFWEVSSDQPRLQRFRLYRWSSRGQYAHEHFLSSPKTQFAPR